MRDVAGSHNRKETQAMEKKVVCFGEIMLRLSPPGHQRFIQARSFDAIYGGGEANVAVSLANYGISVRYVTRLPENELGDACVNFLRQYGIETDHILRGGERLGIYFLEHGAVQRPSKVIYDRAHSAFATIQEGAVDWDAAFDKAEWFHWTGITPAIGEGPARACLEGIRKAKKKGITVSCDLNFRKKLWKWGKSAGEVMEEMVRFCDYAVGNEEDAEKVFGIKAPGGDWEKGKVDKEHYRAVAEALMERFPNLKGVAITLRGSISASHNTWSGLFYANGKLYSAPVYDILPIVDRVGGGDAFAGGLIYSLLTTPDDPQRAINFAVAASCLKHTIPGDFNLLTVAEAEKLAGGNASGRVER